MDSSIIQIITLQGGYNTNLVLASTLLLGAVAGLVGALVLLRGRTLISDAVSHATLPGLALGFLGAFMLGIDGGRNLPALLVGAALTGFFASLCVTWISQNTRLNDDVAIASVLSVFYGAGIVLLSIIQRLDGASQAGLESFLLGQVTGLVHEEMLIIALLSFFIFMTCMLFLKDLCLLCFDAVYAQAIGKPVQALDMLLIMLMLAVVCTGLKTVGLILILALLIIPPSTARLWTAAFRPMLALSVVIGAFSAFIGAALSAHISNIPTGGAIVLSASSLFAFSLVASPKYGALALRKARSSST